MAPPQRKPDRPSPPPFSFNPRKLAALRPRAGPYEVADGNGLRLRVYPAGMDGLPGAKTFRWSGPVCRDARCKGALGRLRPHRHDLVLGGFDSKRLHGLADAQKRLEEVRTPEGYRSAVEALLLDPGAGTVGSDAEMTVGDLADAFYATVLVPRRKVPAAARAILTRDVKGTIGEVLLSRFDWQAASRPVEAAVARGARTHAIKVLGLIKQMTGWATGKHLSTDPAASLRAGDFGAVHRRRERFLTPDELAVLLPALDRAPLEETTRLAVKLLLATGLRTGELLTLRWSDVDLAQRLVAVRVENLKLTRSDAHRRNGAPYLQPLSSYAMGLLRQIEKVTGSCEFVCASWSASGRTTDKALSHALRRVRARDAALCRLGPFTPHDFRRSLATWVSEVHDEVTAQRVLGHSLNRVIGSGVASTYDRSQGLERKRRALDGWGDMLEKISSGERAPVVAIRR